MTLDDAEQLVEQVQIAHRLTVGFYQRLLPLLEQVTDELGLEFWFWTPLYTSRPAGKTKSPCKQWAWDLVPMFASRHVYARTVGERAQRGDIAITFDICLDTNFDEGARKLLGIAGEPDAVGLPAGKAKVCIHLHYCDVNRNESFRDVWDEANWASPDESSWHKASEDVSVALLKFSLEQFIAQPEATLKAIQAAIGKKTAKGN